MQQIMHSEDTVSVLPGLGRILKTLELGKLWLLKCFGRKADLLKGKDPYIL